LERDLHREHQEGLERGLKHPVNPT
jgi:hypothetical protein